MGSNDQVRIVEVGPRDGLQNEPVIPDLSIRLELVERLAKAGLKVIEAGSFVSARAVPAMADTQAFYARLERRAGVTYPALVPNAKGLTAALAAGVTEVAVFAAVTEGFSHANLNASVDEVLTRYDALIKEAQAAGLRVRGYLSCVLGCPYDGKVAPTRVLAATQRLLAAGCYEVSLGDTIGIGTAGSTARLLECLLRDVPVERLALHCHDTRGQAVANVLVGLQHGIRTIDAAVAGLGGCPFAPGARGNVATEDILFLLDGLGFEHGVDAQALAETGAFIARALGRENSSRAGSALLAARTRTTESSDWKC